MKDIDLAGISLQDISNFIQAAESLNFSQVARDNEVSPSAVSKSIARLENATNLILFTRHQGKLRLTPAGKKFREKLEDYIVSFELAAVDAHKLQDGIRESLSIGIPNENVMPELLSYIRELKKTYAQVDISAGIYDLNTLKTKLQEGMLDLIFTSYFEREAFQNTPIRWKIVKQMPLCVFIPESNPLSKKNSVSIADLRSEKFVVHSPSMVPGYLKLVNDLCRPYGFTPLIDKYSENVGAFIMDLVFGNGVLIGDELIKSNFPESVKCFPLEGTVSGNIIAWDASSESKLLKALIRIILKMNGR
ncbi:MAG: LysR family transcriptional regulator [Parasporobacterium sp.]|nr:LysR family transcriptional regulator [Parasporobacterium sp.]MBQ9032991.1 LysR family transcriptional regulator [Parasporobacterium sp.]